LVMLKNGIPSGGSMADVINSGCSENGMFK